MSQPVVVVNVVGLSEGLLARAPRLRAWAASRDRRALRPVLPAVTTAVQASMLTGVGPDRHGIVGNGWYDDALGEVQFWKQSRRLIEAETVWEIARRRDPAARCLNVCWWYAMNDGADAWITPRPQYRADGRKIPDCATEPPELRDALQAELGPFPLFRFWGPAAGIESSRWIASAARIAWDRTRPALTLVYLPHLDYDLQRLGPDDPGIDAAVRAIDEVAADLVAQMESRGARVILLSEYGIEAATRVVAPNRALREAGLLRLRVEAGRELLEPMTAGTFAVCDHQVAHVIAPDPAARDRAAALLAALPGVEQVLFGAARRRAGLDHRRAGDLVLVAERGAWFAHDWWLDDARAPDYQRTVDIHRKPGYDPRELLLDPAMPMPRLRIAWTLLKRRIGFRSLLDVIPLDASLVRGTHGRVDQPEGERPILVADAGAISGDDSVLPCTCVAGAILAAMGLGEG